MKSFYSAVISAFLIMLTVFVCKNYVDIKENSRLENIISFQIEQDGKTETVRLWKNDEDKYFVFLPSYATPENTHISQKKTGDTEICLDGNVLADGDSLKNIEVEKIYDLSLDSGDTYPVQFLKSANVATMYVNTQSGEMDRIYADKSNKEKASISLYTSDGEFDYIGARYGDSIKCRGNATFGEDKKPFLVKLDKPNDLLGMGSARNWVLLANAYDPTNIRNKIVLDFAKKTSLKWTPDCEYVDLYLNGEYNGLYLLCEKVEVGENRLELDGENDFLCKNEKNSRLNDLQNLFLTEYGRVTEISFPKNTSKELKSQIMSDVQLMENEIMDESDNLMEHIDLDSWVIKYLIDEISENIDADFCSSYFYCEYKGGEPRFYAGPIWDYDMTLGNAGLRNFNPKTFIAKSPRFAYGERRYYISLYNKDKFYNRLLEIYSENIFPLVKNVFESSIENIGDAIEQASYLNKIRWTDMYDSFKTSLEVYYNEMSTNEICEYLIERINFLNEVWIENVKYYTVQIEPIESGALTSFAVRPGEKITDCPEMKDFDISQHIWIDNDNGEKFDFSQPIYKDMVLVIKQEEKEESINYSTIMYYKILARLGVVLLGVLIIIMLLMIIIYRRRSK